AALRRLHEEDAHSRAARTVVIAQRPDVALNVVMLGPPGAGKGTQAERFARTHGVPKISTGDILREAIHADTEVGRSAKATIYSGGLVSDDVMVGIVRERLGRP